MAITFIVSGASVISSNWIYQMFCAQPDWAAATERSWFQAVAILAIGLALALRRIRP